MFHIARHTPNISKTIRSFCPYISILASYELSVDLHFNQSRFAHSYRNHEPPRSLPSDFIPVSPSYFTGNEKLADNELALKKLLRKYETIPTVLPQQAPSMRWLRIHEYCAKLNVSLKSLRSSQYRKIVTLLSRLNRINPRLVPQEVTQTLQLYKRPETAQIIASKQKATSSNALTTTGAGKRKDASATATLIVGDAEILVNGKPVAVYFPRDCDKEKVIYPLRVVDKVGDFNIWIRVQGVGSTGQAEASALAISRALVNRDYSMKRRLRLGGCMTADARRVERKKPGRLKARKMPTWVKR